MKLEVNLVISLSLALMCSVCSISRKLTRDSTRMTLSVNLAMVLWSSLALGGLCSPLVAGRRSSSMSRDVIPPGHISELVTSACPPARQTA